jgi:hypothetical protein
MQTSALHLHVLNKANRASYQLLIKWSGWPAEMTTCEDEVVRLLPEFTAWGQLNLVLVHSGFDDGQLRLELMASSL